MGETVAPKGTIRDCSHVEIPPKGLLDDVCSFPDIINLSDHCQQLVKSQGTNNAIVTRTCFAPQWVSDLSVQCRAFVLILLVREHH